VADEIKAISIDGSRTVYVAGQTNSSDFPTTPGAYIATAPPGFPTPSSSGEIFVSKLNPSGAKLAYSTFFVVGIATAIAVDNEGDVYVTGYGSQLGFPFTFGAFQGAPSRLLKN